MLKTGFSLSLSELSLCEPEEIVLDPAGLPEGVRGLLKLATAVPERKGARRSSGEHSFVARAGLWALQAVDEARDVVGFIGESLQAVANMCRGKAIYRRVDVTDALQHCGSAALPIVALISVLVGMILAFLGAVQLQMFGAQIYVADLVGVGMVREMGALMTGIIMAGRTGASFAARLGSMQVNEEVDALTTMGFSPMEFLVLPRMMAMVLMMPLLCIYANVLGILGGAIVGATQLGVSYTSYMNNAMEFATNKDLYVGLFKAFIFGIIITTVACHQGFMTTEGAVGVGKATRRSVIISFLVILVVGYMVTRMFYI